jgi:putative ABC transport system permease protein
MALLFGAVAGVVAAVPPARTVARMAPAEAMRGDTPPVGGTVSLFERIVPPLRHAPVRWRMSLRGIGRNKKRSTSMVLGVVLGMTLILASWGMLDTMVSAMDRQFHEVAVEDASVVFAESVGDEQITAVSEVVGVEHAEPVIGLRATIVAESERYTTLLEGYERDTRVHGFDDGLPAEGLLLGQATEDLLDIGEGDTVVVELPDLDAEITTTVAGFVDEPLGTVAYIDEADLRAELGDGFDEVLAAPSITTAKALFDDGAENATVTRALRDLDEAAAAIDSNEIRELVDSFQVFFYVVVGMMLVFGGIMAFALIYNIISVNVAERSGEFASMRANGLTHRRVASLIVGETLLLTAMGIVPGLLVGYAAAAAFMNSFSSDQFPIQLSMRTASYLGAILVMFVVAGLSLLPALRSVRRIDVGTIVRERAT